MWSQYASTYVIVASGVAVINAIIACQENQGTGDASGDAGARTPIAQQARAETPPLAVAPFSSHEARAHQEAWATYLGQPVEITNSIGMKLRLIPPGEFMMGASREETEGLRRERPFLGHVFDDEQPQHRVRITRPFYLGMYEVTQSEYERVMGTNPSAFSQAGRKSGRVAGQDTSLFPVESVSWKDAVEFCRRLSAILEERAAGRVYRLPTEAEWEYACRAGTTTPFHFGSVLDGRQANCNGRYPYGTREPGPLLDRPTTVGSYSANGFVLYDMHGNVGEWVLDWYSQDYYARSLPEDPAGPASGVHRVNRGGGWDYGAGYCRSACRVMDLPEDRFFGLGFRVAVQSFVGMMPDHPLVASANRELGNVRVERARLLIDQAKRADGGERDKLLAQAASMYDEAYTLFRRAQAELRERLEQLTVIREGDEKGGDLPEMLRGRVGGIHHGSDQKATGLRDMLRAEYLRVQLLAPAVKEELADTTKPGSPEFQAALNEAAEQYRQVYEKYRSWSAGLWARMFEGRCHQKLGDYQQALSLYTEVLGQTDDALRTLKTRTLLLAMECWHQMNLHVEAVEKLGEWVAGVRPNEAQEDEWLQLRLGLARAQWALAEELRRSAPRNPQLRRWESEARTNAQYVSRFAGGSLQQDARRFLAEFGIERGDSQHTP